MAKIDGDKRQWPKVGMYAPKEEKKNLLRGLTNAVATTCAALQTGTLRCGADSRRWLLMACAAAELWSGNIALLPVLSDIARH